MHLYDNFNNRSLDHELHVFAFSNINNGLTYCVFLVFAFSNINNGLTYCIFLKILKLCATSIPGKGKTTMYGLRSVDDIVLSSFMVLFVE